MNEVLGYDVRTLESKGIVVDFSSPQSACARELFVFVNAYFVFVAFLRGNFNMSITLFSLL